MRVRRLPVLDSVTREGETAVMIGTRVIVLSELASAALALIGDSSEVEQVSHALVAEFGAPPGVDPVEATLMVLRELSGQGLVTFDD